MTDIVERLRSAAISRAQNTTGTGAFEYLEWQAADEIESLRKILNGVAKQVSAALDPKYYGRKNED